MQCAVSSEPNLSLTDMVFTSKASCEISNIKSKYERMMFALKK